MGFRHFRQNYRRSTKMHQNIFQHEGPVLPEVLLRQSLRPLADPVLLLCRSTNSSFVGPVTVSTILSPLQGPGRFCFVGLLLSLLCGTCDYCHSVRNTPHFRYVGPWSPLLRETLVAAEMRDMIKSTTWDLDRLCYGT